jgi:hypothetical protein
MPTSEDRQAKALEGILGQLTFLVAEMRVLNLNLASVHEELQQMGFLEETNEAEMEIAVASNTPGVGEFLKSVSEPFAIRVASMYPKDGKVLFSGLIEDGVNPSKRVNGIIQDVY